MGCLFPVPVGRAQGCVCTENTAQRRRLQQPAPPSHIPDLKGLAWHVNNPGAEGRTFVLAEDSGSVGAHSRISVPPWEPGKTEASQEGVIQLRLVHSGSRTDNLQEGPGRSSADEGLCFTEKVSTSRGLDDSALVILSKQDKHIRQILLAGILTSLPLSFVG